MNQLNLFKWTTEGYVKVLRDNLKMLNESVDSFSPDLNVENQRVLLGDVARYAGEVVTLAHKAWEKAQREDGGA